MNPVLAPPVGSAPAPVPGTSPPAANASGGWPRLRMFTVAEYHQMIACGILRSDERLELLHGHLVMKMPTNPPHSFALQAAQELLAPLVAGAWTLRIQQSLTLATSEPEPDLVIARGARRAFSQRHPGGAEVGLVIEVAGTSLALDQQIKVPLYGQAGIPIYWIVDVQHRQVEVYTRSGSGYGPPQVCIPGQMLPVILDGGHLGDLAVSELFV